MGKFLGINEGGSLVTAVKKYSREGSEVTLISSTHIGEREYYSSMRELCENADCVLWEGAMSTHPSTDAGRSAKRLGEKLREGYRKSAMHYSLEYMKDVFDPKNLRNGEHCDISVDELGESIGNEDKCFIESLSHPVEFPPLERMKALAYTSAHESPIDRKRNDIVNKRLDSAKGKTAVLYGANHMKEFEKHLLENGYSLESEEWLVAIE